MSQTAKKGKKGRKIGRNLRRPARGRRIDARRDLRRKALNVARSAFLGGEAAVSKALKAWAAASRERKNLPETIARNQSNQTIRAVAEASRWLKQRGMEI